MKNTSATPEIKSWVPAWLTKVAIFLVILPNMGLFGLSTINSSAAAGYYGFEPVDVQYSMIIFYAAMTGFFSLERRFFEYISVKEYLLLSIIVQVASSYICFITHNLQILLIMRFIQGMANCATTSVCISLIFNQLRGERAREIGYSVIYGMFLCISQISMMLTAPVLESFDYNILYKGIIFLFIPGTILLFLILKNVRLIEKTHLYRLDWPSFVIYTTLLLLIGYILIYGQQYYWFEDRRILLSAVAVIVFLALHVLRQLHLKRPYLSLEVFKYRNFKVGAALIFLLYLCRGTLNVTNSYFSMILGMDPIHLSYMLIVNSAGIVISALVTSRMVLLKKPMRFIWMAGFTFLLIFHVWMRMLFSVQANEWLYLLPLFVQGMGAAALMTPLILFMVSAVPGKLNMVASATGVFVRFLGFCCSIAFINYYSLSRQAMHTNRFQQHLTALDPAAVQKLSAYKQSLLARGIAPEQATKLANVLLNKTVNAQAQIRYAIDYYELVSWGILVIILLIAILPYLNRTVVDVKANQPAPASF